MKNDEEIVIEDTSEEEALNEIENDTDDTEASTEDSDTDESEEASEVDLENLDDDSDEIEVKSKKDEKKESPYSFIIEIAIYALIIFLCVNYVPKYVLQRTIVDGPSMLDNYHDKDNLLVEKVSVHFTNPKRFDVVVFYPKGDRKKYYIKRIIGLPGETVQIKGSDIYIDGKKLEENYGKDPIDTEGIAEKPLKLKKDEFFVLGDNRTVSQDSRYNAVGPVKKSDIAGRAIFRISPLKRFGTIK
ncbi:MAG: signal peptidase I [Lachnospiraceae bacterium]|nr:signal peptidase I [Lachnospiraceae bacterium]